MIDPSAEPLIRLIDLPKHPVLASLRPGKRLSISTIWRWANRGVRGRKLETIRLGGIVCTSLKALERFINSNTSQMGNTARLGASSQLATLHRKDVEEALDQLGF